MNPNPQPTPTASTEPLPAPGTAPADLMATLFPGSPSSAPNPAPTTTTPNPFAGTFGIDPGPAPGVTPSPVQTPAPSPGVTPTVEAPAGGFSIEEFVSRHIADPETLFQGDGRKISQFGELRKLFEGATRDLAAAQIELNQLRQTGPSAAPSSTPGTPLPETEAVQKLAAEIEALKPAAQRWQEQEARQNLRQNPAFRHEFDQPRAAILREIEATASEIGLQPEDVEDFLRLESEFKQAKWIKENVEDDVAADLYREKGRAFLGLTHQAKNVLQADDPIAALREWDDYNSAFATKFAAKLEASAAKELQSATSRVIGTLTSGNDPFFATDSGKAVLSDLNQRAAEGRGFNAEEVVEAIALSRSAVAYQALAQSLQQRVMVAEKEVARLKGFSPNPLPPDPMRGGVTPVPTDLYGFGSNDGSGIRPMIRADQIRVG
jgi:hypothetical protein